MKRVKPVYFHDQRGFLLTFGPEDEELYRWSVGLSSERIREILGIHSFAAIERAAGDEGVRRWMRTRLRAAMRSAPADLRSEEAPPPRDNGWPERDLAIAPRIARLVETHAPDAARVLDPFAGSGLYPMVAAQRGADAFWCEISPVQRFLAVTRFRALFRDEDERRRLADELLKGAESLPAQMDRAIQGPLPARLRFVADRGTWTESGMARELFRAAIVSLLADGERVDARSAADELRRHARHIASQQSMRTFPPLLADDAADLGAMRSIEADLLVTNPPFIGSAEAFPAAAENFLSIDAAAEKSRAVATTAGDVPRGRATPLHRDHELRNLEALAASPLPRAAGGIVERLAAIARTIDEPGKAAVAAHSFAGLLTTLAAVERQMATSAVAIVDAVDSWFGGQLIRNVDIVGDLFTAFGFDEIASESTPVRMMPAEGTRKEHRVIVMRRGARRARSSSWAAWA